MAGRGGEVSDSQLRSVAVAAILAGIGGWVLASLFPGRAMSFYLAAIASLALVVAFAGRIAQAEGAAPHGLMATGELIALVAIVIGGLALLEGRETITTTSRVELAVGAALALVTWLLAQATLSDLEALTVPTATGPEITTPLQRLSGRFLRVGVLLVLAAAVTGGRPAIALGGYWLIGLTGLGFAARRRAQARWRRDRSRVDADVAGRWATNLLASLVMLVAAAGLLLPLAHRLLTSGNRWLAGWSLAIPQVLFEREEVEPPESRLGEPSPPISLPEQAPVGSGWLRDLLVFLAFGALFAFAWMLLNRRFSGQLLKGLPSAVRSVPRTLWLLLLALWHLLARIKNIAPMALMGRRSTTHKPTVAGRRLVWDHHDPVRKRIAIEYFAFLGSAARRLSPKLSGETPSEFGARVEESLAGEPAVAGLTGLYVEARYSIHHLPPGMADQARRQRKTVEDRMAELDE
jgi:hypothetical protein